MVAVALSNYGDRSLHWLRRHLPSPIEPPPVCPPTCPPPRLSNLQPSSTTISLESLQASVRISESLSTAPAPAAHTLRLSPGLSYLIPSQWPTLSAMTRSAALQNVPICTYSRSPQPPCHSLRAGTPYSSPSLLPFLSPSPPFPPPPQKKVSPPYLHT